MKELCVHDFTWEVSFLLELLEDFCSRSNTTFLYFRL